MSEYVVNTWFHYQVKFRVSVLTDIAENKIYLNFTTLLTEATENSKCFLSIVILRCLLKFNEPDGR